VNSVFRQVSSFGLEFHNALHVVTLQVNFKGTFDLFKFFVCADVQDLVGPVLCIECILYCV